MLPPAAAPQHVVDKIANIEAALDDVVNHGSDDELFIASYLQGHFAVESRQVEMQDDATMDTLNERVLASLESAFANNELDEGDAVLVSAMWQRLMSAT
ncbi:YfcL family protein [Alteromonas sp. 345S023]|uniref:YfcL family protein n=1 Tax=Alteromonas profundi TaxID=2696062 RepID=A0A7X5LM50_9ALTE|nr:YfcL family protein [Alteromonas profundi]NDV91925.1 YfcL family protein [Alteromonas profundi]